MSRNKDTLINISKYKEFLSAKRCPENLPDYDDEAYWDARYELEQQEVYDWYVDWSNIKELFQEYVNPNMTIMELGSGKSAVLADMYKDGFKNLIGSDFSNTLINQRRNEERYLKRGVIWERVDITKKWPNWPTLPVDVFFEKATLDCLGIKEVKEVISHIYDSLKPEGMFFHITTAKPESRITLLKMWDVKVY